MYNDRLPFQDSRARGSTPSSASVRTEHGAPPPDFNEFGQPVGVSLGAWVSPTLPSGDTLTGRFVQLAPLNTRVHAEGLFAAFADAAPDFWTYMSIGPFTGRDELARELDAMCAVSDRLPYAILVEGNPLGLASYLRIDQKGGVLEIGTIALSPSLQRRTAATEALYLMIDHCFALGYRRCEWKCDAFNAPSRSAAERLGFRYEGTFRNATHYKGRTRDTAWFAMTHDDWDDLRWGFQHWLSSDNFDSDDQQLTSLRTLLQSPRPDDPVAPNDATPTAHAVFITHRA